MYDFLQVELARALTTVCEAGYACIASAWTPRSPKRGHWDRFGLDSKIGPVNAQIPSVRSRLLKVLFELIAQRDPPVIAADRASGLEDRDLLKG